MTVSAPAPELTQGALVYDAPLDTDDAWRFTTTAEDATFGNPVPLVEEVRSLLVDGSLAEVVGNDNREVSFRLRVQAVDGEAMAQAEAALMAEVTAERPSPLVWTPPMAEAWPAVFDVVHMRIDRDYGGEWDIDERFRLQRYYRVTLVCLPWTRDLDLTTIPALPVPEDPATPATTVTIDTCDSTAGWSRVVWPTAAWSSLTTTATGGYVQAAGTVSAGDSEASISLVRAGAVTMGDTPYLAVDVYPATTDGAPSQIDALFDGSASALLPVASLATTTPNVLRYYFEAPASFTEMRVRRVIDRPSSGADARSIRVYNVARTDRIEVPGSNGFQIARTAVVEGSAPTQAAIQFDATPEPLLGSTALIYTGAAPAISLRSWWVSSATVTPDSAKISGATNDLSSAMVLRIPVGQFHDSTYSLLARLSSSGTYTVNWQARIVAADGTTVPGSEYVVSGAALVKNTTADPWKIHDLAAIQLPTVKIEGESTHMVELTLSMTSGGASVLIDEGWLLDTDNGAVTVIHEPSAFQLVSVELRSPQIDAPRPAVFGTWVTHGTQDITRLTTALGSHVLRPGLLHVFTATDLAKYASCALTYYRRYHTHPGPALSAAVEE